jgi:hypothetical protein
LKVKAARAMARQLSRNVSTGVEHLATLTTLVRDLLRDQQQTVAELKEVKAELVRNRASLQKQFEQLETLRFAAVRSTLREVADFVDSHQLDFEDTVSQLAERQLSFARFGDGELRMLLRSEYSAGFQRNSIEIRDALARVLSMEGYDPARLLLGFPFAYRNLHWSAVWADIWNDLYDVIPRDATFGTSHVTRPIYFERLGNRGVELWRRVWEGRRVAVITGRNSRFELLPGLFDGVKSAHILETVPRNAFEEIPAIKQMVEDEDADVFLIALGPAGTVLAAELSQMGRWAIDVGHINNSWQMIFDGKPLPERLPLTRRDG